MRELERLRDAVAKAKTPRDLARVLDRIADWQEAGYPEYEGEAGAGYTLRPLPHEWACKAWEDADGEWLGPESADASDGSAVWVGPCLLPDAREKGVARLPHWLPILNGAPVPWARFWETVRGALPRSDGAGPMTLHLDSVLDGHPILTSEQRPAAVVTPDDLPPVPEGYEAVGEWVQRGGDAGDGCCWLIQGGRVWADQRLSSPEHHWSRPIRLATPSDDTLPAGWRRDGPWERGGTREAGIGGALSGPVYSSGTGWRCCVRRADPIRAAIDADPVGAAEKVTGEKWELCDMHDGDYVLGQMDPYQFGRVDDCGWNANVYGPGLYLGPSGGPETGPAGIRAASLTLLGAVMSGTLTLPPECPGLAALEGP